jgi:hypothetical protein
VKEIPLTKGQVALVDDEDFEYLNAYKWHAKWDEHTNTYYAVRTERCADGKRRPLLMHRVVLGLTRGDGVIGDHRDPRQTLTNTRKNLRVATVAQNNRNRRANKNGAGGLKGIYRSHSGWRAEIKVDGKRRYLGTRPTRDEAHALYAVAAHELYGEFARTE